MERLRAMFDVPAWAIGSRTVVVLLANVLYQREVPPSLIALSSVTWENVPKPKTLQPPPKRTAIIIALKDFRPTPVDHQQLMHCTMRSLRLWICTSAIMLPRRLLISEAVRKGLVDPSDRTKMLRELKDHLDLNNVVLITAVSEREGIAFEADLVDATTGNSLGRKTGSRVAEADLGQEIRQAALSLLLEY